MAGGGCQMAGGGGKAETGTEDGSRTTGVSAWKAAGFLSANHDDCKWVLENGCDFAAVGSALGRAAAPAAIVRPVPLPPRPRLPSSRHIQAAPRP